METIYSSLKVNNEYELCSVYSEEAKNILEHALLKSRISYYISFPRKKLFDRHKYNCVFCVNESNLVGDAIESEFLEGQHITEADAATFIEAVKKAYMKNAKEFETSPEFEEVFGQVSMPRGVLASKYLDVDLIFDNIIKTDKGWQIIDYEWTFDFLVPINYVFYRASKFSDLPEHLV